MKKTLIYVGLAVLAMAVIIAVVKVNKSNSKPVKKYKTEQLKKMNIVNKVVATGKVIPLEEVEIKPQISGIIDKVYLEEGAIVKTGDLIATVKVVPNEQSLQSARGRINSVQIQLSNAKTQYDRNKALFDKGVISSQQFEASQLSYNQAKNDLRNANNDYQIIKRGSAGSGGANTNIRATASGMVVEIPVKKGYQVIQANNFNAGTTIATIADMKKMIFEGKVDEAEVGKLKMGMDLDITVGAIEEEKFPAKLNFIAPKGVEESGAIQFKVKGDIRIDSVKQMVRAGYSANASIIIEKKDSILSIREALLQYDKESKKPYVEILVNKEEGKFENKDVELGVSDGINVEIISGITKDDEIKVWNKENKKDKKKDD
ncbi:efflux RND transporter periplasmic adaptor subunit [Tenacibaculum sp. S7007]|uniref:Efflux RND transporter periplasmic adaptor subunit n=1 Tax=Tenacibaculum pelagium TaxID=2759527 RepID=A0A839AKN2_9FLAO|nr:efflux RND transporter periplasmic adaptor subunit [Tenacibaculum pelagium]MBA6154926.1 efflux RND transporter periplasmic adaptor subunit [Tenacibaculum pelagium]